MKIALDVELSSLKTLFFEMGGLVEMALKKSQEGFTSGQMTLFEEIAAIEDNINKRHISVDLACMRILARLSPVAHDLRLILAITKINQDLERMGDQATSIALAGKDLLGRKSFWNRKSLDSMFFIAGEMVRLSLDAFVAEDIKKAEWVLQKDDELDALKSETNKEMIQWIKEGQEVESALDIMQVARSLERIGDHSTNIAENVIFLSTGKDIRHGGRIT